MGLISKQSPWHPVEWINCILLYLEKVNPHFPPGQLCPLRYLFCLLGVACGAGAFEGLLGLVRLPALLLVALLGLVQRDHTSGSAWGSKAGFPPEVFQPLPPLQSGAANQCPGWAIEKKSQWHRKEAEK